MARETFASAEKPQKKACLALPLPPGEGLLRCAFRPAPRGAGKELQARACSAALENAETHTFT